jgi:NAD(P)-dependent dehydrogenase (short-subunit alcohol dehydrogenase family)
MSLAGKFDLSDRVFAITGGAGFLGEQHARAIAEFGGRPVILDVDVVRGAAVASEISKTYDVRSHFIECDISDEADVSAAKEECLREFDRIDGLINNATIDPKVGASEGGSLSRLEDFALEQWERELKVGLTGAMLCSKVFGQEMACRDRGVIVNIASDLGVIAPDQRLYRRDQDSEASQPVKPVTYSVIKHGIIGLTKYLATYWARSNIRVNALSPGGVYNGQDESFVNKVTQLIPMSRMAHVDEMKSAVVFLCSDASSYMTGQNLIIDGGRSVW